nr:hypothetical protein BaRGS_025685 [Batillaria attramentaria]
MWLSSLLLSSLLALSSCSSGSAPLNLDVTVSTYLGDGTAGGINTGTGTDVDSDGNVYVVGAGSYNFENNCDVTDCIADLGRDGTLAVMKRKGHVIHVYTNGRQTGSKDLRSNHHHMDIAVDPAHKRIIRATFFQSYPHHVPVQVPCVVAYNYDLTSEVWVNYCVSGEEDYQTQNMADSRPNHIYFSDIDNKLYLGGYTDGGNSIFRLDPREIADNHGSLHGLSIVEDAQKPHYDKYVDTYGMHGAHSISFVARYNPRDGALEEGQFLVSRLSDGSGNSVSTKAVVGGAGGRLVAAQESVSSIENRDRLTINGHHTAEYGGGEAVLLVVSPDFQHRLVWHEFQKTKGHSNGVAVGANVFHSKTRVAFLMKSKL